MLNGEAGNNYFRTGGKNCLMGVIIDALYL
jgi:hypothetical protein